MIGDLLTLFDPDDPVQAELKLRNFHCRLIRYFALLRCSDPENLAQEVMARAVRKIENGAVAVETSAQAFLMGFAKLIAKEQRKARTFEAFDEKEFEPYFARLFGLNVPEMTVLLDELFRELSVSEREIFENYVLNNDRRDGPVPPRLRVQMFRLRKRLAALLEEKNKNMR